ncbi:hypothetical protein HK102_007947 [Quaeritorhiza haematococci]|nr:hypothetical protein HK102_007947 [Quaeritorhiza haematococci]
MIGGDLAVCWAIPSEDGKSVSMVLSKRRGLPNPTNAAYANMTDLKLDNATSGLRINPLNASQPMLVCNYSRPITGILSTNLTNMTAFLWSACWTNPNTTDPTIPVLPRHNRVGKFASMELTNAVAAYNASLNMNAGSKVWTAPVFANVFTAVVGLILACGWWIL